MTAIPYFIHRHRRQAFGFEGLDLERKKRLEIERRATTISSDEIFDRKDFNGPVEPSIFYVKSQSLPDHRYRVDLDAYDCDCLSFPLLRFCKHICAVQTHHPEVPRIVPVSALTTTEPCTISADDDIEPTTVVAPLSPSRHNKDTLEISDLAEKLTNLALILRQRTPKKLPASLRSLSAALETHLSDLRDLLPPVVSIPSHKMSDWKQTADAMGIGRVKGKAKRTNADPYSGNERSAKLAKPDAREPLSAPSCVFMIMSSLLCLILSSDSLRTYHGCTQLQHQPHHLSYPPNQLPHLLYSYSQLKHNSSYLPLLCMLRISSRTPCLNLKLHKPHQHQFPCQPRPQISSWQPHSISVADIQP